MFKYIFLALALLFTPQAKADIWGLNQVLEATCRISADKGYGSGSCIGHKDGQYLVLTNAHVVGNSDTVRLEFFKNGRKTLPLPGKVVFAKLVPNTSVDYALITINGAYFGKDGKFAPRIAQLAPADSVAVGGYVMSAGCPGARWPSGFEGFIISQKEDEILFYPPPLGGQSGSGLYVITKGKDGYETKLKGIVTWRIGGGIPGKTTAQGYENNHGGAILVDDLVEALNGKVNAKPVGKNYEHVIFNRIFGTAHNVAPQRYYYNTRQTVPYPKQNVQTNEMVINPSRLIPLRPKPRPEPEPDIDVTPDIDVNPVPTPDGDNPYEDLPDFLDKPIELNPVPPVVDELQKSEEEKKRLEEEKAKAEAEAARIEAEKQALADKLLAENKKLEEQQELFTWVGGGTISVGGIGALLWALFKKKGKIVAVTLWKKKKPEVEERLKSIEEEVVARLEAKLGFSIPDIAKAKVELAEKKMMEEIEKRVAARLLGEQVKETVSMPTVMDPIEAHAESLSPEAIAILDKNSRIAVLQMVNRTVKDIFKDRSEA